MKLFHLLAIAIAASLFTTTAQADTFTDARPPGAGGGNGGGNGGCDDGEDPPPPTTTTGVYYDWMSFGIQSAWNEQADNTGNFGQGVTITVIDDFTSRNRIRGDLGDGRQRLRHGEWTLKEANMIAPLATMVARDFGTDGAVSLDPNRFDILNLSFRETEEIDRANNPIQVLENSIIAAASGTQGNLDTAFIAKSAGNLYGAPVGYTDHTYSTVADYLSTGLIATLDPSTSVYDPVIFVGALDMNVVGESGTSATMASYSAVAGTDVRVQQQFLVVGVEATSGAGTGLSGTSFAAPIVAGYGAVLSSKFTSATPTQVAQRLLETARKDVFDNYSVSTHGQGEADIAMAIAPNSIDGNGSP